MKPSDLDAPDWLALSAKARFVYVLLDIRANRQGRCWPSVRRIAQDCTSKPATVLRAIKELEAFGLVTVERRRGSLSTYVLHPEVLRTVAPTGNTTVAPTGSNCCPQGHTNIEEVAAGPLSERISKRQLAALYGVGVSAPLKASELHTHCGR